MTDIIPIRRALLSVSDKTGLVGLARALQQHGAALISTGGTSRALREAALQVTDVSDITRFPEMMDGRIKTLHPRIHGGLLALRDNDDHLSAMREHEIAGIDLLAVNLYPFEETVAAGAGFDDCVENIDIGGPAMIRAAAKNHRFVAVATDPADYAAIIDEIEKTGGLSSTTRIMLARKAFARTAAYDAAIASWFVAMNDSGDEQPGQTFVLGGRLSSPLRYGENPHQTAAFYSTISGRPGAASAQLVQGKPLSYNNLNDTDAAFELVAEFGADRPAVAIIKHANPCGVAVAENPIDAYKLALRCDPVSAFGGVIAVNQLLTRDLAEEIVKIFTEVVIAPDADNAARAVFAQKKNLRLLLSGRLPSPTDAGLEVRPLAGGFLLQSRDNIVFSEADLKIVTRRAPDAREMRDLIFAFTVAKHVKSNAIVYARDGATVGVGAGQMSRLDSSRIAARKAEDAAAACGSATSLAAGSVVASDAFFPFADGLLAAAEAGATAVIQPGGSMRDDEVIAAADDAGLAMVFTGVRHFRH